MSHAPTRRECTPFTRYPSEFFRERCTLCPFNVAWTRLILNANRDRFLKALHFIVVGSRRYSCNASVSNQDTHNVYISSSVMCVCVYVCVRVCARIAIDNTSRSTLGERVNTSADRQLEFNSSCIHPGAVIIQAFVFPILPPALQSYSATRQYIIRQRELAFYARHAHQRRQYPVVTVNIINLVVASGEDNRFHVGSEVCSLH